MAKYRPFKSFASALPKLYRGRSFFNSMHDRPRRGVDDLVRADGVNCRTIRSQADFDCLLTLESGHSLSVQVMTQGAPDQYSLFAAFEFEFPHHRQPDLPEGRLTLDRKAGVLYAAIDRTLPLRNLKGWWLSNHVETEDFAHWNRIKASYSSRRLRGIYRRTRDEKYMRNALLVTPPDRMLTDNSLSITCDPLTRAARIELYGYWSAAEVNCPSFDYRHSLRYLNMVSDGGGTIENYADSLATDEDICSGHYALSDLMLTLYAPNGVELGSVCTPLWLDADLSECVRSAYSNLEGTGSITVDRWFDLTDSKEQN